MSIVTINVFAFILALALTRKIKGTNLFRTVFFMPNLIGGIILGYIWQQMINAVLLKYETTLVANPTYGFWGLIILMNWQMIGYMMIIYVAGLQNVPTDLIEAAEIDGATSLQTLFKVKIPMVMPSITICLFLTVSNSFKLFDQNLALTAGAPSKKTAMLALDIYNTFYGRSGFEGVGQAKAVLFFIVVAVIALGQLVLTSNNPFALPTAETFAGLTNYVNGIEKTGFFTAFGWSAFITVFSVAAIILFTSMTAYYLTRVKTGVTNVLYYMFVFSMIVPFQMVMFTMSKLANMTHLNNPPGMVLLYLGFGSGLSVFMFCGFIKSIPLDIEEAAMIDGCNPLQTFFGVVMPILKPTAITVAILNAMWIWNDYLLPYLVIGLSTNYKTIPVVVQYLVGSYGAKDLGAMMALLVLSVIPIIVFYLTCQKYIIEGVVAGAVKG